jgi:membrane associated rhomboid family serine protease
MDDSLHHHDPHRDFWVPLVPPGSADASHPWLDEGRARLLSLILESRGLPFHLERTGRGWLLLVPAGLHQLARDEVALQERENRDWPPPEPPHRPGVANTLATLSVLLLLATFYNVTLMDRLPGIGTLPNLRALGSADSELILQGQWWRLVTALTLHADWLHLSGNLVIGGLFVLVLCRDLGAGLGWGLILASGVLGNLTNALLQPYNHNAVGASTAIFGAVGVLAASSFVRYRHRLRGRRILPVAAALALLATLGTEGANTDLGAHLFGFLWGLALGWLAEGVLEGRGHPGPIVSTLLALASAAAVAGAWYAALTPIAP